MDNTIESLIRIRISENDVHYAGGLVDGARMMQLFGDVATELLIRSDGDEGLFAAYNMVEFHAPVHAGDFIEARGRIEKLGTSSRKMSFTAHKVITSAGIPDQPSACNVLEKPMLVCKAEGTCVVTKDCQRRPRE